MSSETAVKAKKKFKLTKNWIVLIVLVALIGLTVCSCATVQAVTKNPGAAVLDTYIAAAKSQNVKKMAGTFYKKGSEEYKAFVADYNAGKKEYKSFSSSAGQQEKDAFGALSENLNNEAKDRGLRLYWESRIAKNIKDYDYTISVQDKDQVTLSIVLDNKTTMSTKDMPKKYSGYVANGVSSKFELRFRRDPSNKKWYFSSEFRFVNGQRGVQTWTAPYGDGKLEVKKVNNMDIDIDTGVYDLTKLSPDIISIGTRAFEGCTTLKTLIVSKDLVNIGEFAFNGCKNLEEIKYTDGTNINADSPVILGEGAFFDCERFGSSENRTDAALVIPKVNKTIPNYLFYNNKVFAGVSGVVTLPDDITIIGHYAFYGCAAITSVNIPNTVTTLGDSAFDGCTKLTTFTENNIISDKVARIGSNAFRKCEAITSVSLPDNLTDLGTGIFDGCTSLATVKLPKDIKSLGNNLFRGTAIKAMQIPATVEKIGNYAFAESKITQIDWLENDKQKTAIRTIGENAFNNCKALTKLVLPESIKGIGTNAFVGCTSMRSVMVDFPSTAVVGEYAFEMSDGIPKFYVKDELVSFRQKWFNMNLDMYSQNILTADKMFAITEETRKDAAGNDITEKVLVQYLGEEEMVTLDTTLTRLGNGAFAHSAGLKGIANFAQLNLNDIGLNVFSGCSNMVFDNYGDYDKGYLKYLGKWLVDGNDSADGELNLVSRKYGQPADTVGIAAGAFSKVKTALESAYISKEVKYIGENAFMQSNKLVSVVFENDSKLERLGDGAFYSCGSIDHIILPSTLKEIGDRTFQYCDKLRYAVIESSDNMLMGADAFFINYGLPKLYLNNQEGNDHYKQVAQRIAGSHNERSEDSVKEWNAKVAAIQSCMYDTKYIKGDYAEAIQTVTLADGSQQEFRTLIQLMSTGLTEFAVPDGIIRIGAAAFARSTTIEKVDVNSGVQRVEEYAFYDCDSLENVVFKANSNKKDSLVYLGTHVFRDTKLIAEKPTARVTFDADTPNETFTTGESPFDETVLRKVAVKVRAEYEKNEYWKTNRLILDAEDDPWIIIELKIKEDGTNGTPTNVVSSGFGRFENAPGEVLSITADPDEDNGYSFDGWFVGNTRVAEEGEKSISIEYNADTNENVYTAVFTRKTAWVKIDNATGGIIYRDEQNTSSVLVGENGGFLSAVNKNFTLYAAPNPEFEFVGWYTVVVDDLGVKTETIIPGALAEHTFSMEYADVTLAAKFVQVRAWAVIAKPAGGKLTITSHNEAEYIETTTEIRVLLEVNEEVTIKAEAYEDLYYEFNGWAVGSNQTVVSTATTYNFKLDDFGAGSPQNKIIRPLFEKIKVNVTVNFNDVQGSIARTDSGLSDDATTGSPIAISHGMRVTFTAKAKNGFVFKCWKIGSEVVSDEESYSFTISNDDPIVIVAEFEPKA